MVGTPTVFYCRSVRNSMHDHPVFLFPIDPAGSFYCLKVLAHLTGHRLYYAYGSPAVAQIQSISLKKKLKKCLKMHMHTHMTYTTATIDWSSSNTLLWLIYTLKTVSTATCALHLAKHHHHDACMPSCADGTVQQCYDESMHAHLSSPPRTCPPLSFALDTTSTATCGRK